MGKGLAQCTLTRGTQRKPVPSIAGPQMSEDTNEVSRWGLRPEKLKKKKKGWNFVGVCLWILLPTNECVARRCHICPPHCKPGLPAAGPLEREYHRPKCTGSASPVGEKVAIANELDQRFSSCLQATESPYSAIPRPL